MLVGSDSVILLPRGRPADYAGANGSQHQPRSTRSELFRLLTRSQARGMRGHGCGPVWVRVCVKRGQLNSGVFGFFFLAFMNFLSNTFLFLGASLRLVP